MTDRLKCDECGCVSRGRAEGWAAFIGEDPARVEPTIAPLFRSRTAHGSISPRSWPFNAWSMYLAAPWGSGTEVKKSCHSSPSFAACGTGAGASPTSHSLRPLIMPARLLVTCWIEGAMELDAR